jgi:hypothetical protein
MSDLPTSSTGRLVLRNRVMQTFGLVVFVACGLTSISGFVAGEPLGVAISGSVPFLLLSWLGFRIWRACLVVDDDTVCVRGSFRTRRFKLSEIQSARVANLGAAGHEWLVVSVAGRDVKVEVPRYCGRFGPDLDFWSHLLST